MVMAPLHMVPHFVEEASVKPLSSKVTWGTEILTVKTPPEFRKPKNFVHKDVWLRK
jgi:hypothetical protein